MVDHSIALQKGFTLIELSIVLVIVGLIAGGVLVGRDLIHAALLNSQIRQFKQYDEAFATFQTTYNCIPGDCRRTQQFWPALANGNGNDFIENNLATYYDASGAITWNASTEYQNFFISLANAGYIPGTFNSTPTIGQGLPQLKYRSTASFFASDTRSFQVLSGVSRNPIITAYRRGNNALWVVACNVSGVSPWRWDDGCGIFFAVDLRNIDNKIDEGLPLSGKVFGFGGANSNNNCLTGTAYNLSPTTPQCQMAYILN